MSKVGIKSYSYCLNHAPETGSHYGGTPYEAYHSGKEQEYLDALPKFLQSYDHALHYAPNQTYIGGISYEEFEALPSGWVNNPLPDDKAKRYGKFGELMPEDEFLGLISACDEFELVWLEKNFAESAAKKLADDPVITEAIVKRVLRPKNMHKLSEIDTEVNERAGLYLYHDNKVVGCIRSGHPTDPCLTAHVLLENLASKASGVLALLHLLKNSGINPSDLDFVIECSEEGAGDVGQRAGGNFAKAIAEVAGCTNASGCDVRGFCAGPVNAMINAAAQVASGARKNIAVVAGGSIPKLYMNSRDHVKKGLLALEDCLGSFAVLLVPDDGTMPVMRLDVLGKHTVGAGGSPQAVTSALTFEPLQKAGLTFTDVDRYAPELQNHEITEPAGAGNVPLANIKMIAALAVMKKAIEKPAMMDFIKKHGTIGYAPTQGHIPAGVPFIGHACELINEGKITRAMIIGKGSLFLARLTNLADGASFLIEKPEPAKIAKIDSTKIRVGLMSAGSEHGAEEIARGARLALQNADNMIPVLIGPKIAGCEDLEYIECAEDEIPSRLEAAVKSGEVDGAVAMHFPFPLGVTTIGRVLTPGRGRPMILASTTGTSSTVRGEAMLRNAIYGIATAKALGIDNPTVGILNVDTAQPVFRALSHLKEKGYNITFGSSVRADGGSVLRGNDILTGAVDVCVTDTLTGNVLVKMFSSFTTGGSYESTGWGYGASCGEGWKNVVSIVSRASGAPVIANALAFTASVIAGRLPEKVADELDAARKAGLDDEIDSLTPKAAHAEKNDEEVKAPPAEPTDDELHGIDVLEIDNAVKVLWKAGIYAESAMGCTGPVIKMPARHMNKAADILKSEGYL